MKNYYQLFYLLISIFLPLNTHQALFGSNKRQNFYALKKPIMLPPGPIPQPQPIHLSNQGQGTSSQMQLNPQFFPQNGQPPPKQFSQNGQPHPNQLPPNIQQLSQNAQPQSNPYGQPQPHKMPPNGQPYPFPFHKNGHPQPMPQNGHPQPMPQNGHPQPMPQNGHPQPMPQNGHPQPMPQNGHPQPMPQNGHPQPMPQNGHPQPMPQNGHPIPVPQNGHPLPMPQNGHPHPMPQNGQAVPQPMPKPFPHQVPLNGPPHQIPQTAQPSSQLLPTAQPQQIQQSPQFYPHLHQPYQSMQQPQMLNNRETHQLQPPKKGPLPVDSNLLAKNGPMQMPQMSMTPPPNSIHGQKIGIPSENQPNINPNMIMSPPPGITKGPPMGQWIFPNITPNMDIKNMQTLQPIMTTSQPVVEFAATITTDDVATIINDTTTTKPEITSVIPVLPVDNVTSPIMIFEKILGLNMTNETNLIFTRDGNQVVDEPWQPIIGDRLDDDGPVQFVMSHTNSTSEEEINELPKNEALYGPNPGRYGGRREMQSPSKLDSIKKGIFGILFGRKGPPEENEYRRRIPPRLPTNHIGPLPNTRWQPIEDKLQVMMDNRRHQNDKITCSLFTTDVCLQVNDYPFDIIMNDLMRNTKRVNEMYADVGHQDKLELLDGISSKTELSYTFQHYFGNDNAHSHRDYGPEGGNVCPSEVLYARPRRGRNIQGEWKFIINVPQFPQTIRLERCLKPKSKCSYIDPFVHSQCSQLHTLQRTLVWNLERGLHIDVLMFPSACSCYLLPNNKPMNDSNDIPLDWGEDTMLMDETMQLDDTIDDQDINTKNRKRKFTPIPNLLGPYSRTLHKYSRNDLENKHQRPHTNFGRPLVAEKSYIDGNDAKINYNQHSTSDYIKPWN